MAKKKIVNSSNNRAYAIRKRTTKNGKKRQIKGLYRSKSDASSYVKKNFGDVIRKLATE